MEEDHTMTIWTNLGFITSCGSEEEGVQTFPIFQPIRSHSIHLGCRARSLDIILKEGQPRSITSKFGPSGSWEEIKMWKVKMQDGKRWEKLTGGFGYDELKNIISLGVGHFFQLLSLKPKTWNLVERYKQEIS